MALLFANLIATSISAHRSKFKQRQEAKYQYTTFTEAYVQIQEMLDQDLAFKNEFVLSPKVEQLSGNLMLSTEELVDIANDVVTDVYGKLNPDLIAFIEYKFLAKGKLLDYMCNSVYNRLVLLGREHNRGKMKAMAEAKRASKIIKLNNKSEQETEKKE